MSLLQTKKQPLLTILAFLIIVLLGSPVQVQAESTNKSELAQSLWEEGIEAYSEMCSSYLPLTACVHMSYMRPQSIPGLPAQPELITQQLVDQYYKNFEAVLAKFENSLIIYIELGDRQSEADLLTWMARVNLEKGNYLETLDLLNESTEIYDELNSKPGDKASFKDVNKTIKVLTLYKDGLWSRIDKGNQYTLKKFNEALKLVREMGEKRYEAQLLNSIACIYVLHTDRDTASISLSLEYFDRALKVFEQVNDKVGMIVALEWVKLNFGFLNDNSKALSYYKRGFLLSQNIGYKVGMINFAVDMGDTYSNTNNFIMTIKYYQQALNIMQELKYQHESEDVILNKIGETYHKIGDYKNALKAYEKAMYKRENKESPSWINDSKVYTDLLKMDIAEILMNIGKTSRDLGDYLRSIDNLRKALTIYKNYDDSNDMQYYSRQIQVLSTLRDVYIKLGDEENAKVYNLEINKIEENHKTYALKREKNDDVTNDNMVMERFFYLASQISNFTAAGRNDKAKHYIQQLLELVDKTDIKGVGIDEYMLFCRGAFDSHLGLYTEALGFFKQALKTSRQNKNRDCEIDTLLEIGKIYDCSSASDYQSALDNYKLALLIANEIEDKSAQVDCLKAIGLSCSRQNEYEKAGNYLKKALAISKDMHAPNEILMILYSLLSITHKSEQYQEYREYLSEAINIFESVREKITVEEYKTSITDKFTNLYNSMISHLLWLGEYEEAFNYVERARSRSLLDLLGNRLKLKEGKDKELSQEEKRLKLKIQKLLEKIRKKQPLSVKKQKRVLMELNEELGQVRREYAKCLLEIKRKNYELYSLVSVNPLTLHEVQDLLGPDTTLLEYYVLTGLEPAENNVVVCWVVNKDKVDFFYIQETAEMISVIDSLREKIVTCQLDYENEAEVLYELLIENIKPSIKTKRLCIVPHSILHTLPFQALLNVPVYSGLGMEAAIDDGILTIGNIVEGSNVYKAGLKTGDRIVSIDGVSLANISLIEAVIRLDGEPSTTVLLEVEGKVSNAKKSIKIKRELIAKSDFNPNRPAAKVSDIKNKADIQTSFLIEEYDIFYAPSASVLEFVYEKRKENLGKVLAFGNPELGNKNLSLPYAEDELKKIHESYPDTTIYINEDATEGKAKSLAGSYDIIHFASHGELNPKSPLFSCIRMAKDKDEDGRLEVHEIFNLDLKNTSLVTLSACETGLGKLSKGDELIGLTRGFIYAGTPSVVASLWSVNDQSTSDLMSLFYKNLKTHSKVEALRMAQLEMINGEAGRGIVRGIGGIASLKEGEASPQSQMTVNGSHPYFWAPFILLGDWN